MMKTKTNAEKLLKQAQKATREMFLDEAERRIIQIYLQGWQDGLEWAREIFNGKKQ
jgi:hypothetical protein